MSEARVALLPAESLSADPPRWLGDAVTLREGAVFTLSGVYVMDPVTRVPTERLEPFVLVSRTG